MKKKEIESKIAEIRRDSSVIAKNYKFSNEVPHGPNPLGMSKWLTKEIQEINTEIDIIEECHGLRSVCKKGCADCCRQGIVVMESEILPIKVNIENMSKDERTSFKDKLMNQIKLLKDGGISEQNIKLFMGNKESRNLQEKYFNLNLKCVFLDDENSCTIHNVRPQLCWSYREYETAENCKKSCFSDTSFKYDDWDARETIRILEARPGNKMFFLPFAVKKLMNW